MAVVTIFMSDRDTSRTFTDKKEAEAYDKMLELAENVSCWMQKEINDLSDEQAFKIGRVIAENKDTLAKALKGKSDILLSLGPTVEDEKKSGEEVTDTTSGAPASDGETSEAKETDENSPAASE